MSVRDRLDIQCADSVSRVRFWDSAVNGCTVFYISYVESSIFMLNLETVNLQEVFEVFHEVLGFLTHFPGVRSFIWTIGIIL